jgi:hydrogenase nickel incorporation protein HypA/HybF
MHETGIADAIVDVLRRIQAERREPITRAVVQVGELSGITPEHLAEHFREAAGGTEVAEVVLDIEVRGIMAKCIACGAVVEITDDLEACPECGGHSLNVHADDAIRLVSVEVAGVVSARPGSDETEAAEA